MAELNIIEKVLALEGVELLKNLSPEQMARIGVIAREEHVPAGKVVLSAEAPADALYVIVEGTVQLTREGEVLTAAGPGEMLGAWSLFEDEEDAMAVTATTMTPCTLLRIGRDDFYDLLADNSEITSTIFATLVRRFRKLVEQ